MLIQRFVLVRILPQTDHACEPYEPADLGSVGVDDAGAKRERDAGDAGAAFL